MLGYLQQQHSCRSKWIGAYFGDTTGKDCGICDCCLEKKKMAKTSSHNALNMRVWESLQAKPMNWLELKEVFSSETTEQLKASVDFLIGEDRLELKEDGTMRAR